MPSSPVSPLAPADIADLPAIEGVEITTAQAAIKYENRTDVLLMRFAEMTTVAGVLTRSKCPSAAVDLCRRNLPGGVARALLVNSGNANAFTGAEGFRSAERTAAMVAEALSCPVEAVFMASTGVIGEPLAATKFEPVVPVMARQLAPCGWFDAAGAIMTTDTFPKLVTQTARIGDVDVRINGIAKGAGMIAPDMATMLSFMATDAAIPAPVLQSLVAGAVDTTFNAITIDGDTSTSDTVLAFATAAAAARGQPVPGRADDPVLREFAEALHAVMHELALLIVRDGEGASKLVEIWVTGAENDASAKRIAFSIANSPLVKTAVAGEDANWGRVVMAVGKAGERADRDRLAIWFGDVRVAVDGARDPDYSEDDASRAMRETIIRIHADIGIGHGKATVWTCDLTQDYVAINADYRS